MSVNPCLFPVRRLPRPSRSMYFGDVSETNVPRDPKPIGRAIMRPRDYTTLTLVKGINQGTTRTSVEI